MKTLIISIGDMQYHITRSLTTRSNVATLFQVKDGKTVNQGEVYVSDAEIVELTQLFLTQK
jgi:hypothetical protein